MGRPRRLAAPTTAPLRRGAQPRRRLPRERPPPRRCSSRRSTGAQPATHRREGQPRLSNSSRPRMCRLDSARRCPSVGPAPPLLRSAHSPASEAQRPPQGPQRRSPPQLALLWAAATVVIARMRLQASVAALVRARSVARTPPASALASAWQVLWVVDPHQPRRPSSKTRRASLPAPWVASVSALRTGRRRSQASTSQRAPR